MRLINDTNYNLIPFEHEKFDCIYADMIYEV